MPRANKPRPLNQGGALPEDADPVSCLDEPSSLWDCCTLAQPGEFKTLFEQQGGENPYCYWIHLEANETPVKCCALDLYAQYMARTDDRWTGRRTDYVLMGWYAGECYVVFLELRRVLSKEDHVENKVEQVEQAMRMLCRGASESGQEFHGTARDGIQDTCDEIQNHKLVGVIIPALYSNTRVTQVRYVNISGKQITIVPLPHNQLSRTGEITWNNLLKAIGVD